LKFLFYTKLCYILSKYQISTNSDATLSYHGLLVFSLSIHKSLSANSVLRKWKWQVGYSMVHHEKELRLCLISFHRKCRDQHSQCHIRVAHSGKVACNNVEYTTAFLYFDWLCFLWHGINISTFKTRKSN